MAAAPHHVIDRRQFLAAVSDRRVSVLAQEQNEYAAALLGVVYERRPRWSDEQWSAAMADLLASPMTVGQFLAREASR